MTHSMRCGDVIPACAVVIEADSEEALLAGVAAHARDDHAIVEIDDATLVAVRAAITVS